MRLDPFRIALQGLGFGLTPIALAVQGLLALLEEEAKGGVVGGGGRRMPALAAAPSSVERAPAPAGVSYDEVAAQWAWLESRLRLQKGQGVAGGPVPAPKPVADPVPAVAQVSQVSQVPEEAPALSTSAVVVPARYERDAEDAALMTMLLLLD